MNFSFQIIDVARVTIIYLLFICYSLRGFGRDYESRGGILDICVVPENNILSEY